MRVLYIDIDSLRPDHLGCYGYHRNTSPNIDAVAKRGVRFNNCYVSDAPCLPSRTALFSGRLGFNSGVVNHGGVAAEPFIEGIGRGFESTLGRTSWMACLRKLGMTTVSISPFAERHSAWHWYANFNQMVNTGKRGHERADEIAQHAIDWVARNARQDNWFCHVNFWDPHTPYRTPDSFGNPFAGEPIPSWLNEQVRAEHWTRCGPASAREMRGWHDHLPGSSERRQFASRQPFVADDMSAVRKMFDGYDCGVRYADDHIGQILNTLADENVLDDTTIIISSDHGENLGELGIYCDHMTADQICSRVPMIVALPADQKQCREDDSLVYQFDIAATLVELLGGEVPSNWDAKSFALAMRQSVAAQIRDHLVVSQMAWSCQRSVRFLDHIAIRSFHDGFHVFPDWMLFNVASDPHQQVDLATSAPHVRDHADALLCQWTQRMLDESQGRGDPLQTVMRECGPWQCRGMLPNYLDRLRKTDRSRWADILQERYQRQPSSS